MPTAWNQSQGGIESSGSTEATPIEAGVPTTGYDDAPKAECKPGAPGPGVGNSRRGIH